MSSMEGSKKTGSGGDSAGVSGTEQEDGGVSMLDVLQEEQQLEEDANAVLGDSDDRNCTYIMGYVPRQALYACMTCTPESKAPAGVCLACSYACHDGHDLVELYTKRNFRCDCGNSKFPGLRCKFFPDKQKTNPENHYNQNFRGLYCICARPYPDPDDDVEDDMIQCIICEDWLHGRHLVSEVPEQDAYDEMVCAACMSKCDFLWAYTLYSKETEPLKNAETGDSVDVETSTPEKKETPSKSPNRKRKASPSRTKAEPAPSSPGRSKTEPVPGCSKGSPVPGSSKEGSAGKSCQYRALSQRRVTRCEGATFWPAQWRTKLCSCNKCQKMYGDLNVSFLAELNDTITAYEDRGKARKASGSQYEQGMSVLSGMDRMQQVEVLHGYHDMKSELTEYLKGFADSKKVVKEEDIREFFSGLAARKKQRTSAVPQYFCK